MQPKTIFLDIDGTLVPHMQDSIWNQAYANGVLPGVRAFMMACQQNGDMVIMTTGRPECMRHATYKQLERLELHHNQLIMNLPRGPRVVINDLKPHGEEQTAYAYTVARNQGLVGAYDAINRGCSNRTAE